MRVLFVTFAAASHLQNMVTMAWALHTAGHDVRVASQPDLTDTITGTGLTAVPVGETHDLAQQVQEINENLDQEQVMDAEKAGEAGLDMNELRPEKLTWEYVSKVFGTMTPFVFQNCSPDSMIDDLVGFSRFWEPDLVIWDTFTFGGAVAARACGAAHARLITGLDLMANMRARFVEMLGRRPAAERHDPLREWLTRCLERHGATFDEEVVTGQWTIDSTPPSMRLPVDLHYVPVRFVPYNGRSVVPGWLRERPSRKRVCFTLGLSYRDMWGGGARLGDILSAVAALDVEVVAALSEEQRKTMGDLPDNVRVVDFVPLNAVLPTCSAIIHHGGGGTYAAAAAHRVPQIVFPKHFGDFLDNARYVAERGAGLNVDAKRTTTDELRSQILHVLNDPSFAEGAMDLYEEMLGTPGPNEIVPVLERLTARHRASATARAAR